MKAFISSLGMMGRRHLIGLLDAGAHVEAFDPSDESIQAAEKQIKDAGLDLSRAKFLKQIPEKQEYKVSVFAETADYRLENFRQFLGSNFSHKTLLEKPLCQNPEQFKEVQSLIENPSATPSEYNVNFPRRCWDFYKDLKKEIGRPQEGFSMTINSGAIGLACNGLHYLDLFRFLASDPSSTEILTSKIDETPVRSGRGERFLDFGGHFLMKSDQCFLYLDCSSESSSSSSVSIRGKHWSYLIDENDYTYKKWARKTDSVKPLYLYGQDYSLVESEKITPPSLMDVTKNWALGGEVAGVETALQSHKLLFDLLEAGGSKPPYSFT